MNAYLEQAVLLVLLLHSSSQIDVNLGPNVGDAAPGQFPYVVSILKDQRWVCEGAIINQNWIITRAHYVGSQPPLSDVMVLAGTNLKENTSGILFNVSKIIVHEEFAYNTFHVNDIAMIKIDGSFEFGDLVQPVNISGAFNYYNLVTVAGWGTFDTLYYTKMLILDYDTCTQFLNLATTAYPRGPGQFCITHEATSLHDLTGPLINSSGYLVGWISYSGGSFYYERIVYVSTAANYYIDWINNVIRNN